MEDFIVDNSLEDGQGELNFNEIKYIANNENI